MELIPILSLIILVATISTFMLAVGAYILYKLREKKGKMAQAPQPATIPAELLTPAPMYAEQQMSQPALRRTMVEQPLRATADYQQPAFIPQPERGQAGPELKPSYGPQSPGFTESRYQRSTSDGFTPDSKDAGKKKMMRYTSDGYVEPAKDEKKEESLKWR
jgi:hypothetical protein